MFAQRKGGPIHEHPNAIWRMQAGGTYGSVEAAMGWRRSSAARALLLAPLTGRSLGPRPVGVAGGEPEMGLEIPRTLPKAPENPAITACFTF